MHSKTNTHTPAIYLECFELAKISEYLLCQLLIEKKKVCHQSYLWASQHYEIDELLNVLKPWIFPLK